MNTDKRLYLLDAMALVYRAYYAMIHSPRITSKGKNTNAQFGFTNTLFDLIRKENPTHLAVVFDTQAPTERHINFADYKGNRPPAPEDLLAALPDIKRIVRAYIFCCCKKRLLHFFKLICHKRVKFPVINTDHMIKIIFFCRRIKA